MQAFTADDAFNAFVFPQKDIAGIDYLRNQFNYVAKPLIGAAKDFFDSAKARVAHFTSNEAIDFARKTIAAFTNILPTASTGIIQVYDTSQFQGASLTMQRWIMANPTIRELYHNQRIDGYSSSYIDVEPNQVQVNHYDWRRVMDGIMTETEDGSHRFSLYVEDLKEGDRDLTLLERRDILNMWSRAEFLSALAKDDITSPEGGMM